MTAQIEAQFVLIVLCGTTICAPAPRSIFTKYVLEPQKSHSECGAVFSGPSTPSYRSTMTVFCIFRFIGKGFKKYLW